MGLDDKDGSAHVKLSCWPTPRPIRRTPHSVNVPSDRDELIQHMTQLIGEVEEAQIVFQSGN